MGTAEKSTEEKLFTFPELLAVISVLILGFVLQDAIFFHNTRDWVTVEAVTEAVTKKGTSWVEEGGQRHQSWREGTYLYKYGDALFRGFRIELAPVLESTKAPRAYLPKGNELPGSGITVSVDPDGLHGSYLHEGGTYWLRIAYYTCWFAAVVFFVALLWTLSAGIKSLAGTLIVSVIVLGGSYAFTYDGDRILESDEKVDNLELYDLLSHIGEFGYRAPEPAELGALKEGMTIDEAGAIVGRPPYLNINSQRLWWGFHAPYRKDKPSLVFELKEGEYQLTTVKL